MSKETVQQILAMLQAGLTPVYQLRPRKGCDSRLLRITGTDNRNFHGVFVDDPKEGKVLLAHKSVEGGHMTIEHIESSS